MPNKSSPHDKLFEITMSRPQAAKEFLQQYLPKHIKKLVDLETLQIQKESYIDEHLKGHFADLLYSINFGAKKGYFYILFEHLSNPDQMIAFRMLKYIVNIMEAYLQKTKSKILPIVYPIILYTGSNGNFKKADLFDLFENRELAESILWKPYHFMNLHDIADEALQEQIWFGLMTKDFKYRLKESLQLIQSIIPNLKIIDSKGDIDFFKSVLHYILNNSAIKNTEEFFDTLLINLSEETGENMITIADRLRQEGKQEGWQAGKQDAINEIAKNLLKEHEPLDKIMKITGLTRQEVERLAKDK